MDCFCHNALKYLLQLFGFLCFVFFHTTPSTWGYENHKLGARGAEPCLQINYKRGCLSYISQKYPCKTWQLVLETARCWFYYLLMPRKKLNCFSYCIPPTWGSFCWSLWRRELCLILLKLVRVLHVFLSLEPCLSLGLLLLLCRWGRRLIFLPVYGIILSRCGIGYKLTLVSQGALCKHQRSSDVLLGQEDMGQLSDASWVTGKAEAYSQISLCQF